MFHTKGLFKKKTTAKKPQFKRTDFGRKKQLKDKWRKPRGRDNKLRLGKFSKGPRVRVGYGNSKQERGKNKDSKYEVLVHNVSDLEKIDKKKDVAVIAGAVGLKKKYEISKKAKEMGVVIENEPTREKKEGAKKIKAREEETKKKKAEEAKKAEAKKKEEEAEKKKAEAKKATAAKPAEKQEKPVKTVPKKEDAKKPKSAKTVAKTEKKPVKKTAGK